MAARQLAIARGAPLGSRVLALDEPTSSLTASEATTLFVAVRRLPAEGVAADYVSHRLDELYEVCGRVVVPRDDRHVADRPLAGLDRLNLVGLMLGKGRDEVGPPGREEGAREGPPLLRVDGLKRGDRPDGVGLEIRPGEVVGLGGLLGSGKTETARLLFGLDRPDAGTATLAGLPYAPTSPPGSGC